MIKDKRRFNYIIRNGHYNKDRIFVIYYVPSEDGKIHYGIAIKNSLGHAVVRNRLKRQTRSIMDNNKNLFKKDIIPQYKKSRTNERLTFQQIFQHHFHILLINLPHCRKCKIVETVDKNFFSIKLYKF